METGYQEPLHCIRNNYPNKKTPQQLKEFYTTNLPVAYHLIYIKELVEFLRKKDPILKNEGKMENVILFFKNAYRYPEST